MDESQEKLVYNISNHDGELVERIDMANAVTLTKPDCKHTRLKKTRSNEFEKPMTDISCMDCPLGWFEPL